MSIRFELTGESDTVNLVVSFAPTEENVNTQMKEDFWKRLAHTFEQIPTDKCVFGLVDSKQRTRTTMEAYGYYSGLGAYGRDGPNRNGKDLLAFS